MMVGDFCPQILTSEQAAAINPAKEPHPLDSEPAASDDQLGPARGVLYGLVIGSAAWLVLAVVLGGRALGWWS